jgi:hypothetical protein
LLAPSIDHFASISSIPHTCTPPQLSSTTTTTKELPIFFSTTGFYIKIRALELPHFEQSQPVIAEKKKRKEPAKLINDKISNQEEMKELDDDPCI